MAKNESKLHYKVSIPEPHTHYLKVEMEIDDVNVDDLAVKMAVWTPGSYLVREFSKSVENFEAFDKKGNALDFDKTRKNVWSIKTNGSKKVKVTYDVYAFELSVRTSFVDADMAYLNGTSIFMWVDGRQQEASTIEFDVPDAWPTITTALKKKDGKNDKVRVCDNYDMIADSPILIGDHDVYDFEALGIPHHIAFAGEGNYDIEKVKADFTKIAEVTTDVFGENPVDDYTFIIINTENGRGGLEHLYSCSMMYPRWGYSDRRSYVSFLSLTTHEYFHLWNVKRARPIELGPFDYENETYTHLLWVAEGFTSYYDEYLLRRCEFVDDRGYLDMVENVINRYEGAEGKRVQSLNEASFDAWIKFYRRNENTNNCCISYYGKGALIALMLDMEIRKSTKGEKSLDDVMLIFWNKYYKELNRGFSSAEVQQACEQVAGKSLQEFFDKYIDGTAEIDYNEFLNTVGLQANLNANSKKAYLGIGTKYEKGKLTITSVKRSGAAYEHGLNANDEIIAIDGYRIGDDVGAFTKHYDIGDKVIFTISRAGKLREIEVTLGENTSPRFSISKMDNATAQQKAAYEKWMGGAF